MKKRGILNAQLSYLLAALGHKDLFMIGDAGMPIPEGVEVVDLVLTAGVPTENVKFFCNIFSKKFLTLFTCYSLFIMT